MPVKCSQALTEEFSHEPAQRAVGRPVRKQGQSVPDGRKAWVSWLIHHAARRAPETLSERLEEEWRADWE